MKKLTALTLGSMIILNSTSFAFSDLTESHWAYRNVLNMQEKGIISGFEDNTFRPNDSLTREQFITMAVKGLNIEKPDLLKEFEDISNRWSTEYILTAGYAMTDSEDVNFRPGEVALREDVAMTLVRLNNLEKEEYNLELLNSFSDNNEISENRKKYVAIAVENGFMSGNSDGTFAPKKALSRAEGATVIFNILNKVETNEEENIVNWDGEYISNIDGLTKVKLTKISDTEVNFYIRGMKDDIFGMNSNAIIAGDTAKYDREIFDEKREINFKFENSNLVIETNGDENLVILEGVYKIDDGSISTIERTVEKNPFEGKYSLGEEIETPDFESFEELEKFLESAPNSLGVEIMNVSSDTADFSIGGFVDGSMIAIMGSLVRDGDKWAYIDEETGDHAIELEFGDGAITVTGITKDEEKLSGVYTKKVESAEDEFNKYEEYVDEIELGEGGFMY